MKKKTKRKNPADETGRNRRATRKMIAKLEGKTNSFATAWDLEELSLRVSRLELENEAEKEQLKKIMTFFQDYFCKGKK